jgi:hypothetical protein
LEKELKVAKNAAYLVPPPRRESQPFEFGELQENPELQKKLDEATLEIEEKGK